MQLPLSLEIAGQKEKFPTKMAQLCKGEEDEGGQKRKTQHENECANEAHHCDRRRAYKAFFCPERPPG
jgi:hypothetical protein